jgi:TalC/MipB family fructose-6-phosphate aldolase
MEIWLDTANVELAAHAQSLGILDGVTTNPTILSTSKVSPQIVIEGLLEAQSGCVAIQVLSDEEDEILAQAKQLSSISSRILVKIPATQNGFRAIYALSQEGIPTLATAIFDARQALLAFKAGASYLAPYLGRIADNGKNPLEVLSQMKMVKERYGFGGKIMGAGIRDLNTAMGCVDLGICAMTLSNKVFGEFIQDSNPTLLALEKFSMDWSKSPFTKADLFNTGVVVDHI